MRLLSIETSCDETAVSIAQASEESGKVYFNIVCEHLYSQVEKHKSYGGVYPSLAKKEHTTNLPILAYEALKESENISIDDSMSWDSEIETKNEQLLYNAKEYFDGQAIHGIDAIAITVGPGLSPSLWVGVEFANLLSRIYNIPLIPVNHMEGHIVSTYIKNGELQTPQTPILALLISGAHTEFVLQESVGQYQKLGKTQDDAVGECFDKVARFMGLEYPGGPKISEYAQKGRELGLEGIKFPKPMLKKNNLDFSFSGLKTAVKYYIEAHPIKDIEDKYQIAMSFEDTVTDLFVKKTTLAIEQFSPASLVIGGGVSANKFLQVALTNLCQKYGIAIHIPGSELYTDNSRMIAACGFIHRDMQTNEELQANPSLSL